MSDCECRMIDFLIVDDTKAIPQLVKGMLRPGGYKEFHVANNGQQALVALKRYSFNCIIADWHMPEMTGIELLRSVRNDPDLFTIPFLMLSGSTSPEEVLHALEEGVDGYIIKPFNANGLMNSVKKVMSRRDTKDAFLERVIDFTRLKLQRQFEAALAMGRDLLEARPECDVLLAYGECLHALGRHAEAVEILNRPEASNRRAKAKGILGKIYMSQGDYGQAIECLKESMEAAPLSLEGRVELAGAYLKAGRGDEAESLIKSIMNSSPSNLIITDIGRHYIELGDVDRASRYLENAAIPTAETVNVFNTFAMLLKRQERFEESEQVYKRCIRVLPDCFAVHFNMGILYLQLKNYPCACRAMEKAFKINPESGRVGECLEKLRAWKPHTDGVP
jgi:DNA-binding response OmpR family regulator/Tfp pilus assembly protein PilF